MPFTITSQMLRDWSACADGYRWFLTTYPAGEADYQAVLDALAEADRQNDAKWLMDRVGPTDDVLDLGERVERKHLFAAGHLRVGSAVIAGRVRAGRGIKAGRGIEAAEVQVSAERSMSCGIGHCGRCQLGPLLICRDGPVLPAGALLELMAVKQR